MIKLRLKRKISGKAIRKSERQKKLKESSFRYSKWSGLYSRNKPEGRKYPPKLYELEADYETVRRYNGYNYYRTLKPRKTQKKALKIYYKLFPYAHPDAIAKRKANEKKRIYEEKMKNLCQKN